MITQKGWADYSDNEEEGDYSDGEAVPEVKAETGAAPKQEQVAETQDEEK